jgi:signal peptidase I
MEPTLLRNARITATVVKSGEYKPVDGDIVLFDPPVDWNPDPAGGARIYRVAAIGGESIACCDAGGRIQRNGTPIDEPYVKQLAENEEFDRVEVPAGQLFLLGDNRAEAGDSTIHGLLPADTVIGVVKP